MFKSVGFVVSWLVVQHGVQQIHAKAKQEFVRPTCRTSRRLSLLLCSFSHAVTINDRLPITSHCTRPMSGCNKIKILFIDCGMRLAGDHDDGRTYGSTYWQELDGCWCWLAGWLATGCDGMRMAGVTSPQCWRGCRRRSVEINWRRLAGAGAVDDCQCHTRGRPPVGTPATRRLYDVLAGITSDFVWTLWRPVPLVADNEWRRGG